MKTLLFHLRILPVLALVFQGAWTTEGYGEPALPAEVDINPDAGRGGIVIVTLQLADGAELPMWLDTGTSGTFFDLSLAPKLGKPLGTSTYQSWGVVKTNTEYAMPKLYLGGAALLASRQTMTVDFHGEQDAAGRPIMGILGWDCLRHYCVQLDFTAGKLRFLDDAQADRSAWGRAFPIVPLNDRDPRPAVAENLLGESGPHSLIDSGCNYDGWLMPQWYAQWTNQANASASGDARSPNGRFAGEACPFVQVEQQKVESDGIGIRFLARYLVTLDFPRQTLYLKRQSAGPLPDPQQKITRLPALDPLVQAVLGADVSAARTELARIEQSEAGATTKTIAEKLEGTLENVAKPSPAEVAVGINQLALGDARPESAEVGWLTSTANRIPLNSEIIPPFLDSGKIYATGLFAHAPSRYVFNLGGQWRTLHGEAGLHTVMQGHAYGVVFVIKTDGKEVFRSAAIHGEEHPSYNMDVTGVKTLELVVEKSEAQNGGNWALWLDPNLTR